MSVSPETWITIVNDAFEAGGNHFMNFASLLFAYIVAMYVAGTKLTRFQISSVTLLYSVFLSMPARNALSSANTAFNAASELKKIDPEMAANFFPNANLIPVIAGAVPFLFIAAWAVSIAFMLNVRRSSNDA